MGTHKGTHVYVFISKLIISMNCLKPPVLDISTIITTKTRFDVFCGTFVVHHFVVLFVVLHCTL